MSWYPLNDLNRTGLLVRHRIYVTGVLTALLLLIASLAVGDRHARCLVSTQVWLPRDEPAPRFDSDGLQHLQQTARDPRLLGPVCHHAGVQLEDLGVSSLAELGSQLEFRLSQPTAVPGTVVRVKLWTAHPRAAQKLLDELARELAGPRQPRSKPQTLLAAHSQPAAEEQQRWAALERSLDQYLDAVRRLMDDYFAAVDSEDVDASSDDRQTHHVSTHLPVGDVPQNRDWLSAAAELGALEAELERLSQIYADKHPVMIRMKREIAALSERLAQSASAPAPRRTAEIEVTRLNLRTLEESSSELRDRVASYITARQAAALRPVVVEPPVRTGRVLEKAHVAARRGGWWGTPLIGICATCGLAAVALAAGGLRPSSDVLRSAEQLRRVWKGEVIGSLGYTDASRCARDPFVPAIHVAEVMVALGIIALVVCVLRDPEFGTNFAHDPRLALSEFLRLVR